MKKKNTTVCTQFFGVESNGGHHHCNIVYGRQHEWSNKNARTTANRKKTTHEEMKLKLFLSTVSPVMSACALQPFHITLRKTSWRNGSLWIIYNISSCPSWIGFTYSSFCICVQRKSLLYRFQIQTMNVLKEGNRN